MKRLKEYQSLLRDDSTDPIKVAILDTGVDLPGGLPTRLQQARYESYSWVGVADISDAHNISPNESQTDPDGHGTRMVSIVLDIARNCKLYVVQVAGARNAMKGKEANGAIIANIARVK
jgi:hypothetical protein